MRTILTAILFGPLILILMVLLFLAKGAMMSGRLAYHLVDQFFKDVK